jgi:hypothetical protein
MRHISLAQFTAPNKACTGQVGFVAIFEQFSGFEFFLLSSIVHARPPASNANQLGFVSLQDVLS